MPLILGGRIVPLDPRDPAAAFQGRVFIDEHGRIEAVTRGAAAGPPGYDGAAEVDVGSDLVLPGLIDAHNHLGYNMLPLWAEPRQKTPFLHHKSWTGAKTYNPCVSWPAWATVWSAPEAALAYVQARALVGGTTSVQGWPSTNRPPALALRNIDTERAGSSSANLIYTAALTETKEKLAKRAQALSRGAGFIYHCAEGQQGSLVKREFQDVAQAGCLRERFMAIHCNAVIDGDWALWAKDAAGAVVWSPFSNLWLYGSTTRIDRARAREVRICLGSDWGPSGTKHVLAEVKVAKLVSAATGPALTARELVEMITCNPGDLLAACWGVPVGRLVRGGFGDVTVLRAADGGDPFAQVVAATEQAVRLVVVNGQARYGEATLMDAAGAAGATVLPGVPAPRRKIALPHPADPARCWAWKDVTDQLAAVRRDPAAAIEAADDRRGQHAGPVDGADAPLELTLDMPAGDAAFAGRPPAGAVYELPPLPTLVHDAAFFAAIKGRGFHGGLLDGLAAFYRVKP